MSRETLVRRRQTSVDGVTFRVHGDESGRFSLSTISLTILSYVATGVMLRLFLTETRESERRERVHFGTGRFYRGHCAPPLTRGIG